MDTKLIESAEKVLEGFKTIIALAEQARLEEVSAYDVVAGGLIRMGIDLNDSRIASVLSPTVQLAEELLGDDLLHYASCCVDIHPVSLTLHSRRGGGKIILSLPAVLADIEQAWQSGYLGDLLAPEVAAQAGLMR
jgi:hypothetical protein